MIEPQPHVIVIFSLAALVAVICQFAGGRLASAGLTLFFSFVTVLWGQLVLGLVAPSLTVLTALCDMVSLGVIGWALIKAQHRTGLHVAGFAMCVSLMSHVAYHVAGIGQNATLAYFLVTNTAMVIACLGLFVSGTGQMVAKYGLGHSGHSNSTDGASWARGLASRREGLD